MPIVILLQEGKVRLRRTDANQAGVADVVASREELKLGPEAASISSAAVRTRPMPFKRSQMHRPRDVIVNT